jgi:transcription elongation GreA/GreB family factor
MRKYEILKLFLDELERELNTLLEAAFQAKEAATSEESKPENKYDTRGLEASYLAGAQAKRATELRDFIDQLKRVALKSFSSSERIETTALVQIASEDGGSKFFFIVPREGGAKIDFAGHSVFVISPESPMGQALWHKHVGDAFEFQVKGENHAYEIVNVE